MSATRHMPHEKDEFSIHMDGWQNFPDHVGMEDISDPVGMEDVYQATKNKKAFFYATTF